MRLGRKPQSFVFGLSYVGVVNRALLPLLLALGVGLAQAEPPQSGAEVAVRPGQVAALHISFALKDYLLSREAPSTLKFTTPWGTAQGIPSGQAHADAAFAGYYAKLRMLSLRVNIPAGTRPGAYPARLNGQLFACAAREKLCTRRELDVPLTVYVLAAGQVRPSTPLRLTDELLAPALHLTP